MSNMCPRCGEAIRPSGQCRCTYEITIDDLYRQLAAKDLLIKRLIEYVDAPVVYTADAEIRERIEQRDKLLVGIGQKPRAPSVCDDCDDMYCMSLCEAAKAEMMDTLKSKGHRE